MSNDLYKYMELEQYLTEAFKQHQTALDNAIYTFTTNYLVNDTATTSSEVGTYGNIYRSTEMWWRNMGMDTSAGASTPQAQQIEEEVETVEFD